MVVRPILDDDKYIKVPDRFRDKRRKCRTFSLDAVVDCDEGKATLILVGPSRRRDAQLGAASRYARLPAIQASRKRALPSSTSPRRESRLGVRGVRAPRRAWGSALDDAIERSRVARAVVERKATLETPRRAREALEEARVACASTPSERRRGGEDRARRRAPARRRRAGRGRGLRARAVQ